MRWPRWFARWRVRAWDRRLAKLRREWQRAIERGQDRAWAEQAVDGISQDKFFERLVTLAMRKRTLWRKRSVGVRGTSGKVSGPDGRPGA